MVITGKVVALFSLFLLTLGGTAMGANECDGEDIYACYFELGFAELEKENFERAYDLFKMSCEGANSDGCYLLAGMELEKDNMEEAIRLLKKACNAEHTLSCVALDALSQ